MARVRPEWRFGRGWSTRELAIRLQALASRPLSAPASQAETTSQRGWRRYHSEAAIAHASEETFARARALIARFEHSDPRIVTAHFDRAAALLGRPMLLELRVLGLRYLGGVLVRGVRERRLPGRELFGFRYDTVEGHVERGHEWFLVWNDAGTGQLRLRIDAVWRPGQFPNWWSRLGFGLLARRYQRAWHRLAYVRMRALLQASGLPPLPPRERILHEGRPMRAPPIRQVARGPAGPAMQGGREMSTTKRAELGLAAGLGAVAGLRALLAPALLGRALRGEPRAVSGLRRLLASRVAAALPLLAAAELAADKLPSIPRRTLPLPLAGRAASGAFVGQAAARRGGLVPALVGAAAAVAAAFAAYHLRRLATDRLGVPNVVAGLAEDALALAAGAALAARTRIGQAEIHGRPG